MKIRNIIDIITNSSSECYQIKNPDITVGEFKEKWFEELIRRGLFSEKGECLDEYCKGSLSETLIGEIYEEDGNLYLDYPVLCNIDFDIKEVLNSWFGSENVEDISWK